MQSSGCQQWGFWPHQGRRDRDARSSEWAPHIAVQLLECLQARMLPGLLSLLKRQLDPEPRCAGSGASWLGILAPSLASWVALGRQLATPGPLLLNIFTKMKGEDVCAVFCPASGMW